MSENVPSWAALVVALGLIFTWIERAVALRRWKHEEDERRETERKLLAEKIQKGCRDYTSSREYVMDRDDRTRELAREEIDTAFRDRSPSFVDAKVYAVEMNHVHKTLEALNVTTNKIYGILLERGRIFDGDITINGGRPKKD